MKDLSKWLIRNLAIGIAWIFALSITVRGEMLFFKAHDIVIQNRLVQGLFAEAQSTWADFKAMARTALSDQKESAETESF